MKAFSILLLTILLLGCEKQHESTDQCQTKPTIEKGNRLIAVLPTDSGMHGLWDAESFGHICSARAWEKEFLQNSSIERNIEQGIFVPINVYSDGAPSIELRTGTKQTPADVLPEEKQWIKASSKPYLFNSKGSVTVSGIEYIGGLADDSARTLELSAGKWSVVVHYLEADEAERSEDDLYPPDFLLIINPENNPLEYRKSVHTFDKPIW